MNWSKKAYRLNEISTKIDLPCVVRVTEGYYGDVEAESFSQGDMIKVDKHAVLQKVAAHFVAGPGASGQHGPEEEILIPLNYNGKLNVLCDLRTYNSVAELSAHAPRYAKVLQPVRIPSEYKGGGNLIRPGTVVEVDRRIPAIPAVNNQPAKESTLVVMYVATDGQYCTVQLPTSLTVKSRAEPDSNEYTLREAIDRFSLPQCIEFTTDEIQRVFTQNLIEGVENMTTVTGSLCLNKLVHQDVLIGHYKAQDEADDAGSSFVRRSIIVIPINRLWDIEVNVLEEEEDEYQVFVAQNFSQSENMGAVDGVLYADFSRRPAMVKLPVVEESRPTPPTVPQTVEEDPPPPPPPPPRPPKPDYMLRTPPAVKPKPTKKPTPVADPDDSYEEVNSKVDPGEYVGVRQPVTQGIGGAFDLAGMNFSPAQENEKKSRVQHLRIGLQNILKPRKKESKSSTSSIEEEVPSPVEAPGDTDDGNHVYDVPDELPTMQPKSPHYKRPPNKKPTASVAPMSHPIPTPVKALGDLSVKELGERLQICRLDNLAQVCKENLLDGRFLISVSDEDLIADPFKLTKLQIRKLALMKKDNWIPDEG